MFRLGADKTILVHGLHELRGHEGAPSAHGAHELTAISTQAGFLPVPASAYDIDDRAIRGDIDVALEAAECLAHRDVRKGRCGMASGRPLARHRTEPHFAAGLAACAAALGALARRRSATTP